LTIIETIATLILINAFPSIHIVKLIIVLIYLAQPIIFNHFIKKYFQIDTKAKPDRRLIEDRWNGLAINIAAFIHNNTDITVLTILTTLQTVSVYSVYALVSKGLTQLMKAISGAIAPSIGNLYAKGDMNKLNERFDLFEFIFLFIAFFLFGVGIPLITPFVMIYTHGITDVEYYQPIFGILLLTAELISSIRGPALRLGYGAGKFKDMTKAAFIETGLNIVISILLVSQLGIIGVAIGTLVAMTFRTFWQNYYLKDHLINRPFSRFIKNFLIFAIPTAIIITICMLLIPITEYTVSNWIIHAIVYASLLAIMYVTVSLIFFRNNLSNLKKYLKAK